MVLAVLLALFVVVFVGFFLPLVVFVAVEVVVVVWFLFRQEHLSARPHDGVVHFELQVFEGSNLLGRDFGLVWFGLVWFGWGCSGRGG